MISCVYVQTKKDKKKSLTTDNFFLYFSVLYFFYLFAVLTKLQNQSSSSSSGDSDLLHALLSIKAVLCDQCGSSINTMILGERYKSKHQTNYDLCKNCYTTLTNPEDQAKYQIVPVEQNIDLNSSIEKAKAASSNNGFVPTSTSNFGGKMKKKSRKSSSRVYKNKTGYKGVSKNRTGSYRADIYLHGRSFNVGKSFKTKREAALAYDHAAIRQGTPTTDLNFPNGIEGLPESSEDEEDEIDRKKNQNYISCEGYTGVSKYDETRFLASVVVNQKRYYLGLFYTKEQAKQAYDEAVVMFQKFPL